jgi:hypothetical protein
MLHLKPSLLPDPPTRLVVVHSGPSMKGRSRVWRQALDPETLVVCRCGWWLTGGGEHYRAKVRPRRPGTSPEPPMRRPWSPWRPMMTRPAGA